MPGSIDPQTRRRRQAIGSALSSALWQGLSAGLMLWLRRSHFPEGPLSAALLALAIVDLAMLVPLFISLHTRLQEIKGGEEDEASQY